MQQATVSAPCGVGPFDSDQERLASFDRALTSIRDRVEAQIGDDDVRHIKRLNRFSRGMEVAGRVLIHVSPEPVSFLTGVACLWVHKQLQTAEIGHTVLHGAYDKLDGAEAFRSDTFVWQIPIDEVSWREGHNLKHHGFTNIARKDIDINFGGIRLTEHTPHREGHNTQLLSTLFVSFPFFAWSMNMHFSGIMDVYGVQGWRDQFDVIEHRDRATVIDVHKRALRGALPTWLKEFVFFPALAGPFFWKVALGNWLSDRLRDVYSAATIYCGHIGEDVASYPAGTRAGSRGRWYAMQVEASNNFRVSWPFNVLCGGLEHQIEHHLFPKLPPARLRQIAPEVERACREHGVDYRNESWGRTLSAAIRHIARLSHPQPERVAHAGG
ncbi:MAG: fatty acid desaturase [Myxococcales bacterium]|nr:fatty acid desaturase [Myxococcales bacterium]